MQDLAKVSSYYVEVSSRDELRDRLREVLNHQYQPSPLHTLLAKVPVPLVIVTTNYDNLLEEAFKAERKPYDLVIYPAEPHLDKAGGILWWKHGNHRPESLPPNELYIDLTATTVIYKIHGSIIPKDEEWDNFVITEEDYIEFLSRMTSHSAIPKLLLEHFLDRNFLFLGYSLRDWNLRVLLKNLSNFLPSPNVQKGNKDTRSSSWAIQLDPSELEKTLWGKRDILIFDQSLEEFTSHLWNKSKLKKD